MKIVILTSGPRGAGKSTYVESVQKLHPNVQVMSRDALLLELFGSTSLNPYAGGHEFAQQIFRERLQKTLSEAEDLKLIVDYWNGYSRGRKSLIEHFREYGADRVICWQFVVPVDVCVRWFFKKPDSQGYSESGRKHDHAFYYKEAAAIDEDGFDAV